MGTSENDGKDLIFDNSLMSVENLTPLALKIPYDEDDDEWEWTHYNEFIQSQDPRHNIWHLKILMGLKTEVEHGDYFTEMKRSTW